MLINHPLRLRGLSESKPLLFYLYVQGQLQKVTVKRILEHYFQVIGGIKYEECINEFEGEDKLICKALIAFINDGSHSIFDDLVVSFDESSLENYLRVFKLIFERLHHIDHYNMMMRVNSSTEN